jgi:iron complex transport system ATP-binding protein
VSALLTAERLGGGYPGRRVLHEVDFRVSSGECVVVLGPNGTGKSTLLRLLLGILSPASGRVELSGRPLAAWRRREIARLVAYVPQLVGFAFPLTVREAVEQGRAPHLGAWRPPSPADHTAVAAALAAVGLTDRAEVPVQRLSGGERQLVLLARAFATEPRALLLDEPATGLDVRHQLDLVAVLRRRVEAGVGAVVAVHDWNLALRLAHRVVVLHRGTILADGPAVAVLQPELFREAFGVEVEIIDRPGEVPLIVPRGTAARNE